MSCRSTSSGLLVNWGRPGHIAVQKLLHGNAETVAEYLDYLPSLIRALRREWEPSKRYDHVL
jgi:hypothetical protein